MTDFRCPIDGAPLRSATHPINADSTFVHIDGTTHGGGWLEVAETFEATMAKLSEALAPVLAELNAEMQRFGAAARSIEWPTFPAIKPIGGSES